MEKTVADYIVDFLIKKNVHHVFGYQGGMIAYLFDSFKKQEKYINYHIPYHEQGGSFAACGYAQTTGNIGFCFVTSGPGFTNVLTGMANAYCDSIPVIFISGNVNYKDKKHGSNIRQKGFQELETAKIANPICKKTYDINFAEEVPFALNEAYHIATSGRKGPVFLDIPINVFREYVDDSNMFSFDIKCNNMYSDYDFSNINLIINNSMRPVILVGAGIKQSSLLQKFKQFIAKTNIPVVSSMLAIDVLPDSDKHKIGFLGPDAKRTANYLISKSDCVISLGSRLDPRQTGYNVSAFAPNAVLIRVDIDQNEFDRHINDRTINVNCDLGFFMDNLSIHSPYHIDWLKKCQTIKDILSPYDVSFVNRIVESFSRLFPDNIHIFLDVGKNELWGAQSIVVKDNTHVYMSGGLGSMGYSLPAAIGSSFATGQPTISINGDGGVQMNVQELQTISTNRLPVKIIVINNHSLGNVAIFQDRWLGSRHVATQESEGDYYPSNIVAIAKAYGIRAICLKDIYDIENHKELFVDSLPVLFEINVPEDTPVLPDIPADKDALKYDNKLVSNVIDLIENIIKE